MFENFYTVFYLGPIPIRVWGFFVALGMILSLVVLWKRSEKLGFNAEKTIDIAIWAIISGLVFARLFHAVFYEPVYFFNNPVDILKIWQGGLSSFGGLFGALLAFFIFFKRKKIAWENLPVLADLFAFSAVYGWILGRVGCVMIHDHLGKLTTSFLSVKTIDGARFEMAFLEILGLIPLAVAFFVLRDKKLKAGYFTGISFAYYGALRFGLDFLRAVDVMNADARYLGLTPGQYFGILLMAGGAYIMKHVAYNMKHKA